MFPLSIQVEEILKDRIEDNWRDVSRALVSCDPLGSAKIFPSELRRILEKHCLPVSDEHFQRYTKDFISD